MTYIGQTGQFKIVTHHSHYLWKLSFKLVARIACFKYIHGAVSARDLTSILMCCQCHTIITINTNVLS